VTGQVLPDSEVVQMPQLQLPGPPTRQEWVELKPVPEVVVLSPPDHGHRVSVVLTGSQYAVIAFVVVVMVWRAVLATWQAMPAKSQRRGASKR
jgi:hypothetical protein